MYCVGHDGFGYSITLSVLVAVMYKAGFRLFSLELMFLNLKIRLSISKDD